MKVRTFRVGLCNNQLLLFLQDQRAQEISVACLLFLEMTAPLWQPLCNTCLIHFRMLGCCFMNVLWFSVARAFVLGFLLFLNWSASILTLDTSLVLFGSCDGASDFCVLALGWSLRRKESQQKSLMHFAWKYPTWAMLVYFCVAVDSWRWRHDLTLVCGLRVRTNKFEPFCFC